MAVKIYTTPTCPWCKKTKEFLKSKKIPYKELNVVDDEKARREMIKKSGQMGVPVLDIDGKIVVGFDTDEILRAVKKPKR
ncbi:glutathione S-transferase N-terminal domain-containing protein [Candidatus Woesearchaeota archaeon]|nr:glutathione S-transferase N-terminal domain-containing protein [Candidatus Woesearchaeota archaeon]